MRRLIGFIIANSSVFVFIIYTAISLVLLFRFNPYQQSVFFTSANEAAGRYYSVTGQVVGYFGLRDINKELQKQNSYLKMEVARLDEKLRKLEGDASFPGYAADSIIGPSLFAVAQAVNVTTTNVHNYVTLNKGREDGVTEGMGVINRSGVVGIVSGVSDHFSVVISLLNPKLRISCKVKGSDYFGSLSWDGDSPEYVKLEELPRHVKFSKGDTIVTSGYSSVFPQGVMVGTIEDFAKQHDDNFYALRVKLSTDYFRLGDVCIIANPMTSEKAEIEEKTVQK